MNLAIALLAGGLFILLLELFIPSAGMLFFAACGCIIASVIVAFQAGTTVGGVFLGLVVVLAAVLPGIGFQLWRRSPLGRQMFLEIDPEETERDRAAANSPTADLIGEVGKTLTPHRPSGVTEINGRRVDTVSEGVMIDEHETVRVVAVTGNRVVVRKYTPTQPDPNDPFAFDPESLNNRG